MSLTGFHKFAPGYVDPDDDSINARRRRERWDTIEWVTANGHYDAFLDWILNGQDNLTYQEWFTDRPRALDIPHVFPERFERPIPPPNRLVR